MSAPNKSYDPVEVEALKPEQIERMRDEALAAFAAADSLDALHEAKVAHTGVSRLTAHGRLRAPQPR
jgi:phenylalanyl-tRNA synthetase alpha chain